MIVNKIEVHNKCTALIDDRIERLNSLIESAQKASSEDTKSSAGDKYETSREMMQAEKDKASQQIFEALKLKKVLHQINENEVKNTVELGSLIKTTLGVFYISVALGEFLIDDNKYFAISPVSPIGKALLGIKANDSITFNGNVIKVFEIY